jgi:type I restriction enzyme S subunit
VRASWARRPLAEVAKVVKGVSFDKSEVSDSESIGLVPILRAGNIGAQLDTVNDLVWVPKARVSTEQRLTAGDIAIAMSSGSPAVVGKTAQLEQPWSGAVGAFCAVIRFGPEVSSRFGSYWLKGPEFVAWRLSQRQGANIQNLRKSDLEAVRIPVPPLAEQRRIVAILDAADELRRLRAEADRRTADLIPALFHEMFGDPATNPKGWPTRTLAELSLCGAEYGANASSMELRPGNPRYVRITDVLPSGKLRPDGAVGIDSEEGNDYLLAWGDLLFARSGATVGKTYLYDPDDGPCVYAGYMIRFRLDRRQIHPFVALAVTQTEYYRTWVDSKRRAVAQPNINGREYSSFLVPCPPMPLQTRFADRVVSVRELQRLQWASNSRLGDLFQSLLLRAFQGEL